MGTKSFLLANVMLLMVSILSAECKADSKEEKAWAGDWVAESTGEHTKFTPLNGVGGGISYNVVLRGVTWNVTGDDTNLTGKATLTTNLAERFYSDVPRSVTSKISSLQMSVKFSRLGDKLIVAALTGPAVLKHLVKGQVKYGPPDTDFMRLSRTGASQRNKIVQSQAKMAHEKVAALGPITDGPILGKWVSEDTWDEDKDATDPQEIARKEKARNGEWILQVERQADSLFRPTSLSSNKLTEQKYEYPPFKKTGRGLYVQVFENGVLLDGKTVNSIFLDCRFEVHGKKLLNINVVED